MPEILLLVGVQLVDLVGAEGPVEEAEIGDGTVDGVGTTTIISLSYYHSRNTTDIEWITDCRAGSCTF